MTDWKLTAEIEAATRSGRLRWIRSPSASWPTYESETDRPTIRLTLHLPETSVRLDAVEVPGPGPGGRRTPSITLLFCSVGDAASLVEAIESSAAKATEDADGRIREVLHRKLGPSRRKE